MLEQAVAALGIRPDGRYVDGTYGGGGHAAAILKHLGESGRLLVIDKDPAAIARARARYGDDSRVVICHGNFGSLKQTVADLLDAPINGVLLDLGVSSGQLDDPDRGFSFQRAGPLDMRMDTSQGKTAAQWLAAVDGPTLVATLRTLGEERNARRVAAAVISAREQEPIETTTQLAEIIERALPRRGARIHPATKSFQAIRMAINEELDAIDRALSVVPQLLAPGGRLVVVSFHSLEDRRVKRFMRRLSGKYREPPPELPAGPPPLMRLVRWQKKPSAEEIADNRRARSARLRVAERTLAPWRAESPLFAEPRPKRNRGGRRSAVGAKPLELAYAGSSRFARCGH